jgi:hypothetical protein
VAIFSDAEGGEWRYDEADRIGEAGGFGQVFRGVGADGRDVAVKRVRLAETGESAERRRVREVEIGDKLRNAGLATEHLVVPLGHAFVGDDLMIAMPLADESLQSALNVTVFDLPDGLRVVRDVTQGLIELAGLSILHRVSCSGCCARARRQAANEAARHAEARIEQGHSDLQKLVADTYESLRRAVPDARADPAGRKLIVGPVEVAFDVRKPPALSQHRVTGFPRTILVGSAGGAHLYYELDQTGRLRWTFARDLMDEGRRPLTLDAIIGIVTAAIEAHGRP